MKISKRAFISFDTPCKFNCKFCYTYGIERNKIRTMDEMLSDLENEGFDVLYVSQKNDNFSDAEAGIDLCVKSYNKFRCHIFIITRNVFNSEQILRLKNLKEQMENDGKQLFIACSINASSSWTKYENELSVPSPEKRFVFLEALNQNGLNPILMLRPVFPSNLIPSDELLEIVESAKGTVSCIVTGGLGVNDDVLNRLGLGEQDLCYNQDQEYLQGAIECEIKFVDVERELEIISRKCDEINIPLFLHSMQALNYLLEYSRQKITG